LASGTYLLRLVQDVRPVYTGKLVKR
jgi:hypothetical protein